MPTPRRLSDAILGASASALTLSLVSGCSSAPLDGRGLEVSSAGSGGTGGIEEGATQGAGGGGGTAPPVDPCTFAKLGDGAYCAGSLEPASTDESTLYECQGQKTEASEQCRFGCAQMPDGVADECKGDPAGPRLPTIVIHADGMHFTESEIRPAIESGVAYMLQRMSTHAGTAGETVSTITIDYSLSGNGYCSGFAGWDSTDIACPWGYPVEGDNQNYVVNITMHEIGHMLAAQMLGSPDTADRDLCENEGVASWIAGKYWMNVQPATAVGSLRDAALADIEAGKAWASMSDCVSASDAWYTVYASFFEYLEKEVPGGVHAVATGAASQWDHVDAWAAWMQP